MGERRLFRIIFKNFWESLRPRQIFGNQIGKDNFGNKYFEIPADPSRGKRNPSRWFQPPNEEDFDQTLPTEWESWLRRRRKSPPTEEEIRKNLEIMQMTKNNAAKLDEKFASTKSESFEPPKKGYESFPKYDDYEVTPGEFQDKKK